MILTLEELGPKPTEITSNSNTAREEKLLKIGELLSNPIEYYNWVGFYFANHETKTLHLSPYVSAETTTLLSLSGKGFVDRLRFSMLIL